MTPDSDDKSNRTAGETVFSAKKAISSFPGEVGDGRPVGHGQRTASSGVVVAVVECRLLPSSSCLSFFLSFPSSPSPPVLGGQKSTAMTSLYSLTHHLCKEAGLDYYGGLSR